MKDQNMKIDKKVESFNPDNENSNILCNNENTKCSEDISSNTYK